MMPAEELDVVGIKTGIGIGIGIGIGTGVGIENICIGVGT